MEFIDLFVGGKKRPSQFLSNLPSNDDTNVVLNKEIKEYLDGLSEDELMEVVDKVNWYSEIAQVVLKEIEKKLTEKPLDKF
jgi:hypothetical protein